MSSYSVAVAKNTLPRLIDKALAGEEVVITRHGKPVAQLSAPPSQGRRCPAAYRRLMEGREGLPSMPMTSVELLDLIYEGEEE
ncbi:MAG: type II toxin-antitoxin system Phd/YefM family antitoxin [Caulobacteraceae bacterium]